MMKSERYLLFGKRRFRSPWKNLNEFYKVLDFSTVERYKFRESFGYITQNRLNKLQNALDDFIKKYEDEDLFFAYQIVSFSLGISKDFYLYLRKHHHHTMYNKCHHPRNQALPYNHYNSPFSAKLTLY